MTAKPREPLSCSFCDRSQHEVAKLIAGPDVYICDECVARAARRIEVSRANNGPRIAPLREDG